MTSPYPELRTVALIESAEAVANNLTDAILYEITKVVGTSTAVPGAAVGDENCDFFIGDGRIDNAIEAVMKKVCQALMVVMAVAGNVVTDILDRIGAMIESFIDTIVERMGQFVESLVTRIGAIIETIAERVSRIVDAIVDALQNVVTAIAEQVRRIVESLETIMRGIFDRISDVVSGIIGRLGEAVEALVDGITAVMRRIRDGFTTVIQTIVDAVWSVLQRIGSGIADLLDTLVGTAEAGLGRVRQVIEDIPATLRELATSAQEFIGEKVGDPLSNIGDLFVTQIEEFFARLIDDLNVAPESIVRDFLTGVGLRADEVERIATSADAAMPRTPLPFLVMALAIIPFLLPSIVTTVFAPILQEAQQEVAQRVTPTLIPASDAMEAFFRGALDETGLTKELGEAGFHRDRIDVMIEASMRLMSIGDLLNWWLRDFLTDNQLDNLLAMHRVTATDRALIKQAVFFIPPVQDIIRMAVREVFTPDIRTRFQLDEGFPPDFQKYAKQQGVSEEWARNYWASHWVLPSVTHGFEMLHRKVISAEDLDLLLRAQDVMPFWRERLTQIAYHPLTRVDLRRMHKLGLLDSGELQERYEALGFNVEDAGMMVQFTEAYNADPDAEVALELEGLTRSTILNMMDDGILSEPDVLSALMDLGISEAAAGLFITQRLLEQERRTRNATRDDIVRLAGGGHISLEQAQDTLGQLGLTATEIALAVDKILSARGTRDRLPTLAQLDKMLGQRIINQAEWSEAVGGLGYSDTWAGRLLQLTGGETT